MDEKAKLESNLQPAPPPKSAVMTHPRGDKAYIPQSTATRPNYLTTDPFVLDVIKHGIKLDFCGEPICSNLTPLCSLSAEGIKAVNKEIQTYSCY